MAEETKRIIEIEAKYETLAQLQKIIEQNKEAIADLDKTSVKYQKGLSELKAVQSEYNQNMRLAVKENTSAKGSYNDLVNQLARLKEMWKQADPKSDAFKEYTRQVNEVKAQLEGMDHSIGNWQRNVGNYSNSIASISGLFGSAGRAATGAIRSVQGLTMGFQALSATPVIGTLTLLVSLIAKVAQSLKQSEAASMRMAEALAPLKSAGQLAKIAFEGLANGLASVAEWLGKVADKLGLFTDRMRENQALVKEGNALKKRERELLVENSKLELESAKARNIAADKARVSVQDRIKALETAEAAEKRILANELEIAQKKFDLAKREAALAPNDAGTNDALAQAEANLYRVQTSYEQGMRRIVSQHSAALKEMGAATASVIAETGAAIPALIEIDEKWIEQMDKTTAKRLKEQEEAQKFEADMLRFIAEQDKEAAEIAEAASDEITQGFLDNIAAQEQAAENLKKTYYGVASAISSILDSVAGAYQNEIKARVAAGRMSEEEGEREFENVKALQYGVTWINTLSAVVGALADPTAPSWVLKAANAATALATGIANTVKISNTTLGNTQTSSATGAGVQSVQTVAPAVQVAVPEYRTITSASDEQSINDRFADQKVVLVTSELEAHNAGRKVKLAEATF